MAFLADNVPSLGYKTFSILSETAGSAQPTAFSGNADQLENRFYRIRFDPTTGAITSIRDKELNVELVDQSAAEKFNEYLYEHYESPDRNIAAKWHRVKSANLSATQGPLADVMSVTASAVGASRVEQTVILYHDLKRVDFIMALDKSPSGRTLADYNANNAMGKESRICRPPTGGPRVSHSPRVARRNGRTDPPTV